MGVSRNARESTVRAAFKRMATIYHPDKAGGAYNETFQRLNHIHIILTDSKTRSAYNKDPFGFPFPGDSAGDNGGSAASSGKENKAEIVATCIDYVDVANLVFCCSLAAYRENAFQCARILTYLPSVSYLVCVHGIVSVGPSTHPPKG